MKLRDAELYVLMKLTMITKNGMEKEKTETLYILSQAGCIQVNFMLLKTDK